ncbi:CD276 antigen -like protein Precursor [Channa argus]|uniref:CD276 antigen-like protein n=1 Tax=Channa argus TaxID=215402 RepID=A0A6G1PDF9_CHAAH|nr:CD276 antigen -like protein Precursor [Channa argus]
MDRGDRPALVPLLLLVICSLTSVICQLQVYQGFIGLDVLLPCVYSEEDPLPETVSVYWRDKDDNIVLDIIDSSPKKGLGDLMFRERVESFPELFKNGNFSIILRKLQQTDAGLYECHIPKVDFQVKVSLMVSDAQAAAATTTTLPHVRSVQNAAEGLKSVPLSLLCLPLSVVLWCLNLTYVRV